MAYSAKTNWKNNDIVKPDDLNRIERGISDSAQKDLSNVDNANFLAKAKTSNISVFPGSTVKLYVSPAGSDVSGDGSSAYPFKTIQKALDTFPDANDLSVAYTLTIREGSYSGFILNASKNIVAYAEGAVTINGDMSVTGGTLIITTIKSNVSLTVYNGTIKVSGGCFDVTVPLTVSKATAGTGTAITCNQGAHFGVKADLMLTNYDIGVSCSHGYMSIRKLKTEAAVSGVICEGGIVQIGAEEMQATTKFVIQHGGRIYVGAQSNLPNY